MTRRGRAAERRVRVNLGERSYGIRIGEGLLAEAGEAIARATGARVTQMPMTPERVLRAIQRANT